MQWKHYWCYPRTLEHKASFSSHYFLKPVILEPGMELYNSSISSNQQVPGALSMAEKNLRHKVGA